MPELTDGLDLVEDSIAEETFNFINRFLAYIQEPGIQVQLLEQIAKSLPPSTDQTPYQLLSMAFRDIFGTSSLEGDDGDDWMTVDYVEIVDSAPSLEFLARHARLLDPRVFPTEIVPSEVLVDVCLAVFHRRMPQANRVIQTPEEWLAELYPGTVIVDMDGWRDKSFEEPVRREEFEQRFKACTIRPPVDMGVHRAVRTAQDPDPGNF